MAKHDQKHLLDNPIHHPLTEDTLQAASDILAVLSCAMNEAVVSGSESVSNGLVLMIRWIRTALEHEIEKKITGLNPPTPEETRETQNDQ